MALDLAQLQQVLDSAQKADAFKADVKRALRKVSSLAINLQAAIVDAESLLSDDYIPTLKERKSRVPNKPTVVDEEAPYGRKKDGTPKGKPGRSKE